MSRNVVHQEWGGSEVDVPTAVQSKLETRGSCIESVGGTFKEGCFQLETTDVITTKPWALPWASRHYSLWSEGFDAITSGTSEVLAAGAADLWQGGETLAISERPPIVTEVATSSSWQGLMVIHGANQSHAFRKFVYVCLFWDVRPSPEADTTAVIYQMDCFKEVVPSSQPQQKLGFALEKWLNERGAILEHATGTFANGRLEISGRRLDTVFATGNSRYERKHFSLEAKLDTAEMVGTVKLRPRVFELRLFESPTAVLQLNPNDDLSTISCVMLSGEESSAVAVARDELMLDVKRRVQVRGIPSSKLFLLLPSGELLCEAHMSQTVEDVFG